MHILLAYLKQTPSFVLQVVPIEIQEDSDSWQRDLMQRFVSGGFSEVLSENIALLLSLLLKRILTNRIAHQTGPTKSAIRHPVLLAFVLHKSLALWT